MSGEHTGPGCPIAGSVVDPHLFDVDPDSNYHPDADPDSDIFI